MNKIHMIGNAHLDPVWLRQWQEGYHEVKATFRSALDRLREFDGFVFTCACACHYRWVEESDPEMFEAIPVWRKVIECVPVFAAMGMRGILQVIAGAIFFRQYTDPLRT